MNSADEKLPKLSESPKIIEDLQIDPVSVERLKLKRGQDFFINTYNRLWGEKLTYSVGLSYGTGLLIGSTYGLLNAIRTPALTTKLKINSILNECTLRSTNVANPMSVISKFISDFLIEFEILRSMFTFPIPAMFYCSFYRISKTIRKKDDFINSAISGAISGALYKSASSRKMMVRYSIFSSGELNFLRG